MISGGYIPDPEWLSLQGAADPECEGHESLDGADMGATVYCDGSCVTGAGRPE